MPLLGILSMHIADPVFWFKRWVKTCQVILQYKSKFQIKLVMENSDLLNLDSTSFTALTQLIQFVIYPACLHLKPTVHERSGGAWLK